MSEKRDLWVSLLLTLAGIGLLVWNLTEGRPWLGILAIVLATLGAVACLPIRVKLGQARNIGFGLGLLLCLVPFAPGAGGSLLAVLPWLMAGLAFLVPLPRMTERSRAFLLGGALVLAVMGLLTLLGALPHSLTWLFLAGAFHLAIQVLNARERKEPLPPPGPRVCVMGGSYDPFHTGHRALAEAALRVTDRLLVVPAGQAPHKQGGAERTAFHHRLAMAKQGVEGMARTEVLQMEGRRAGPSYTVDTLDVLRRSYPAGTRFLLLLGADMLQDFPSWREWERILEDATLLVARRPGWDDDLPPELDDRKVSVETLDMPERDVSSSAIRAAIAAGESVSDQVSPAVLAYIRDHGLYGSV